MYHAAKSIFLNCFLTASTLLIPLLAGCTHELPKNRVVGKAPTVSDLLDALEASKAISCRQGLKMSIATRSELEKQGSIQLLKEAIQDMKKIGAPIDSDEFFSNDNAAHILIGPGSNPHTLHMAESSEGKLLTFVPPNLYLASDKFRLKRIVQAIDGKGATK